MDAGQVLRDVVLVGGGHSHAVVLRRFAMRPEPGVRLTLICNTLDTPYSGMLPGYIAGHYDFDAVHIDLPRLAAVAGARFFHDEVVGLDRANGQVLCRHRPPVPYDLCAINTGSTPQVARVPGASEHTHPVKPIQQFNARWLDLLAQVRHRAGTHTLAVVGGGAGGVELALAMQFRLSQELQALGRDPNTLVMHLLTRDAEVMSTHNARVRQRFTQVLAQRGIHLHTQADVQQVTGNCLLMADGRTLAADHTVWATQAGGPAWLASTGLALDADGFVQTNAQLQSSDPRVFAAGDVASFTERPLEKAGVFAVRMGRPLADNLRRALRGEPLRAYRPQRHWLALISTGDRYAVASRGPWSAAGGWLWRWKNHIDQGFMRQFNALPAMPATRPARAPHLALAPDESAQALSALAMRCGGCGAKVGPTVLAQALGGLQPLAHSDVLLGLHAPDDAAVVRMPPGQAVVQTVDFFRSFVDDPYRFGRIAAHHALGDIFAMGAQPHTATAIATVPPGLDRQTEALLAQMMGGAVEVLNAAGCALVGGHTGEGHELALGFAINGLADEDLDTLLRKGGMRPGNSLVLTKPLGTGILLAAQHQPDHVPGFRGRWVQNALASMDLSSQAAAQVLLAHGATACTDVTGFGLLGHLLEMTRPSGTDAALDLSALPVLAGAEACAAAGIASSLAPANQRLRQAVHNLDDFAHHPRTPLLFDPQTAGGLLASVPAMHVDACLRQLHAAGYTAATVIGQVLPRSTNPAPVRLQAGA